MMVQKHLVVTFLALFMTLALFSQNSLEILQSKLPQSPEAASLGKYGNIPISTYNGTATISIPIHTIQVDGISVPISLSYHSSGIGVDEQSSSVGLGWSLNAGGVLTRAYNGSTSDNIYEQKIEPYETDDWVSHENQTVTAFHQSGSKTFNMDLTFGYLTEQFSLKSIYASNTDYGIYSQDGIDDFSSIMTGVNEGQPDIYTFNVLGTSGKFTVRNGEVSFFQKSDLKVIPGDPEGIGATPGSSDGWTVYGTNGLVYYFGFLERISDKTLVKTFAKNYYLEAIHSIFSNETIVFEYYQEPAILAFPTISQTIEQCDELGTGAGGHLCDGFLSSPTSTFTETKYQPTHVKSISYNGGKVEFLYGTREDIIGDKKLEEVRVYGNLNQLIKKTVFDYSYFVGNSIYGDWLSDYSFFNYITQDERAKRLRLDRVQEFGSGTSSIPPYVFTYNTADLPYKSGFAKDYWGFFNGETSNSNFLPNLNRFYNNLSENLQYVYAYNNMAERGPNETFTKAGILETIKYPTGGTSNFEYELHEYQLSPHENAKEYLGKKVESVQDYDDDPQGDEKTVNIPEDGMVDIAISLDCFPFGNTCQNYAYDPSNLSGSFYVKLERVGGGYSEIWHVGMNGWNNSHSETVFLQAGDYTMKAGYPDQLSTGLSSATLTITFDNWGAPTYRRKGGGLRIAKIYDTDGMSQNEIHVRKYNYEKNSNTSGRLMSTPSFVRFMSSSLIGNVFEQCPNITCDPYDMEKFVLSSNSVMPLSKSASSAFVGYDRVTELFGENAENGKVVYNYHNHSDEGSIYNLRPMGLPMINHPENGLMYEKNIFDVNENKVQQIVNDYSIDYRDTIWGVVPERLDIPCFYLFTQSYLHFYKIRTATILLDATTEIDYYGSQTFEKQTDFEYEPNLIHTSPIKQTFTNSDGVEWITHKKFSSEYQINNSVSLTDPMSMAIDKMKDLNVNVPIEVHSLIKKPNNSAKVVDGNLKVYGLQNGRLLLKEIWKTELNTPSVLNFSSINNNNYFDYSSYYTNAGQNLPISSFTYNSQGKLIESRKTFDVPQGIIWDPNNRLPIAMVKGAAIDQAAYTSFEENGNVGGWENVLANSSFKKAGKKAMSLTGKVVKKSNLDQGLYLISFWQLYGNISIEVNGQIVYNTGSNNRYTLHTQQINLDQNSNSIKIRGSGIIDELRLHPRTSQLTSYNYDLNTGMLIGKSDLNNNPTTYIYDQLNRLIHIKDFQNNIINSWDYNFDQANALNSITSKTVRISGISNIVQLNNLDHNNCQTVINYGDGLGRDVQSIKVKSAFNKKDQISFFEYDDFGRLPKSFKPFAITSNGGNYRSNAKSLQNLLYGQTNAYEENKYDNSPLNKVIKIAPAGSSWAMGSGHEIQNVQRTNSSNEVRMFNALGVSVSHYPSESLNILETIDEEGHSVLSYSDKLGREIMSNKEGHKTFYVYDDFGRLKFVIPTKAFQKMLSTNNFNCNSPSIREGIYKFEYDSRGQMIRKKTPGKATERMIYDRLGRLVLTIDGNGSKSFLKYDNLGRTIMTGVYFGQSVPNDTEDLFETRLENSTHGYSESNSFPQTQFEIHNLTYYDDHDINNNGTIDNNESFIQPTDQNYDDQPRTFNLGLPTAAKVAKFTEKGVLNGYESSKSFYNNRNQIIQSVSDNVTGQEDVVLKKYNFTGQIIQEKILHRSDFNNLTSTTLDKEYTYDHMDRPIKSYLQINGGDKVLTSKKSYNDRDELIVERLGATNSMETKFLQTVNFSHDLHGNVIAINNPNACGDISSGGTSSRLNFSQKQSRVFKKSDDLFAMKIYYEKNVPNLSIQPKFNGNINAIEYRDGCESVKQGYGFEFDNHDRIRSAHYVKTNTNGSFISDNMYDLVNVSYDENGNIEELERNGLSGLEMDKLSYTVNIKNHITHIEELGDPTSGYTKTNTSGSFVYDSNGNMIKDEGKGLNITYNQQNMPTIIAYDNLDSMINYYNSGGTRYATATKSAQSNQWNVKTYIGEFEYYNGTLEAIYFSNGRVVPNSNFFEYQYSIKDHLGNSRVNFADKNGDGEIKEADGEVLQRNHYYPFGMSMEGSWNTVIGTENQYKYNDKEFHSEFGLNWYDYGVRWYDPAIARWHNIDPLAETFVSTSPYVYSYNSPIKYFDSDGAAPNHCCNGNAPQFANWNQYTIKQGESLSSIAKREYTTVQNLLKWNPQISDQNNIYAGETLNIAGDNPPPDAFGARPQSVPTTSSSPVVSQIQEDPSILDAFKGYAKFGWNDKENTAGTSLNEKVSIQFKYSGGNITLEGSKSFTRQSVFQKVSLNLKATASTDKTMTFQGNLTIVPAKLGFEQNGKGLEIGVASVLPVSLVMDFSNPEVPELVVGESFEKLYFGGGITDRISFEVGVKTTNALKQTEGEYLQNKEAVPRRYIDPGFRAY
ncbi:MAG: DUF6443 domain-containing protein [Flavobacteriales bacterium]|nr:DUF6443 domain-containing protein [Flavobacteriales bacterium]